MQNDGRFRRGLAVSLVCLVLFWGVVSWAMASWMGLWVRDNLPFAVGVVPLSLPAIFSWPARELSLELAGLENVRPPATPLTLLVNLVYAALLWLPMWGAVWRRFRVWPFVLVQTAVLLTVFALLWRYGNG